MQRARATVAVGASVISDFGNAYAQNARQYESAIAAGGHATGRWLGDATASWLRAAARSCGPGSATFVRNVAMVFDAYLARSDGGRVFSATI